MCRPHSGGTMLNYCFLLQVVFMEHGRGLSPSTVLNVAIATQIGLACGLGSVLSYLYGHRATSMILATTQQLASRIGNLRFARGRRFAIRLLTPLAFTHSLSECFLSKIVQMGYNAINSC